jgi:CDP-2,3-bis-(O-geranylgeranyl)-sn-glycerol synthase
MDWIFILKSLYFFLPAYFANMVPTFAKKFKLFEFLAKSVDSGKQYKGTDIFGSHKTWRGIILGTIAGIIIAWIQKLLYKFNFFQYISFYNYQEINVLFLGFLISLGALLGDLFFSFLKRRKNIKPGDSWVPFDQIGYILGPFLLVNLFFQKINIYAWFWILIFSFFLHMIGNRVGFWLKVSDNKI